MQDLFNQPVPLLKEAHELQPQYHQFLKAYPIHDDKWNQFMIVNQLFPYDNASSYLLTEECIDSAFEHYLPNEDFVRKHLTKKRFPFVLSMDWLTPEKLEDFLPYLEEWQWSPELAQHVTEACLPFFDKYFERCHHWDWLANRHITPEFLEAHYDCHNRRNPEDWRAITNRPNLTPQYWNEFFERYPPLPDYHDDYIFEGLTENRSIPVTFFERWLPFLGKYTWFSLLRSERFSHEFFLDKWPFMQKANVIDDIRTHSNCSITLQVMAFRLILAGYSTKDTFLEIPLYNFHIHQLILYVRTHVLPPETIDNNIRCFRSISLEDCAFLTPTQFVQLLL